MLKWQDDEDDFGGDDLDSDEEVEEYDDEDW